MNLSTPAEKFCLPDGKRQAFCSKRLAHGDARAGSSSDNEMDGWAFCARSHIHPKAARRLRVKTVPCRTRTGIAPLPQLFLKPAASARWLAPQIEP